MSNNEETRRRLKIGTTISQRLVPLRDRPTVGKMLGMSPEHVRQVECAALFKIATRLGLDLELDQKNNLDVNWKKV